MKIAGAGYDSMSWRLFSAVNYLHENLLWRRRKKTQYKYRVSHLRMWISKTCILYVLFFLSIVKLKVPEVILQRRYPFGTHWAPNQPSTSPNFVADCHYISAKGPRQSSQHQNKSTFCNKILGLNLCQMYVFIGKSLQENSILNSE